MALAIGAGCQGTSVDDVESSEAANTEGRPLTVIAAREWGRCWFDAVSTGAQLSCTSTPRGEDPLGAKLEVTSVGYGAPDPSQVVTFSKDLDIEAGGTVVLGTFPRTSFPVMVMMHVTFTREASEAIGNHRGVDLWLEPKVDRPEDLSSSRPAVINPGKCYGLQHPRGVGGRLGVRPLKSGFLKYGSVFAQPQDRKSRQKHVDIAGHG